MEDAIRNYVGDHMNDPMNDVLRGLEEELQWSINDRRYKLKILAASSNGNGSSWSVIVEFCRRKHYMHVIQPWSMCPLGSVEVESVY